MSHASSQRGGTALLHFQNHERDAKAVWIRHGMRLIALLATCALAWVVRNVPGTSFGGFHPAIFWVLVVLAVLQLVYALAQLLRNRSGAFQRMLFTRQRWR